MCARRKLRLARAAIVENQARLFRMSTSHTYTHTHIIITVQNCCCLFVSKNIFFYFSRYFGTNIDRIDRMKGTKRAHCTRHAFCVSNLKSGFSFFSIARMNKILISRQQQMKKKVKEDIKKFCRLIDYIKLNLILAFFSSFSFYFHFHFSWAFAT